jgi:sterol desaturase/sphingolipid hydroxylase (fatty acid hydroxylase superfamily)
MEFLRWYLIQDLATFRQSVNVGGPFSLLTFAGALIFAALFYIDRRRSRGRAASLKGFVRSMLPDRVVFHPSTAVDLRMWIMNAFVLAAGYGMLAVGGLTWRNLTVAALTNALGAHAPLAWPVWVVMALSTVLELLAYEFAYWYVHYLCHRVPALWEFHKVHHSAEVMTALTELRQHPVEIIAVVNGVSFTTGLVFGAMTYVFGPGVGAFTLFNANIVLMLFLLTWGHLRHSHLWIAFTGVAGKILVSPAHHQIHHSTNPKHFDKNLGFALSVWDWVFGTLYVPSKTREVEEFGVGETRGDYESVTRAFLRPFVRAGEHYLPETRGVSAPALPQAEARKSGG